MSSWVQLLALVVVTSVRFGSAEGDPLPAALVELVRTSPISSMEDLQLLLLSDSTDGDAEDRPDQESHSNNTVNRVARSLDAQPAQQALCKVRTEVTEVTRAMLDRSNANFLPWPPCVEVQRCSGCCNTKILQCVPVLTHTRHLQVMKIQYINKLPTYAKAVVSVVDHVECRCQPAPRPPPITKKKPAPHRAQKEQQGQGQSKGRSKEELHRRDEVKHNQRLQLEELLEQHWGPREPLSPSLEAGEGYSLGPHWAGNSTGPLGGRAEAEPGTLDDPQEARADSGVNGTERLTPRYTGTAQSGPPVRKAGGDPGEEVLFRNHTEGTRGREGSGRGRLGPSVEEREQETQRQPPQTDWPSQTDRPPQTDRPSQSNSSEEANQRFGLTEATNQRRENRFRPTEETNQGLGEVHEQGQDNDTPGSEVRLRLGLQKEQEKLEEERRELLLLHQRLDQEKELLRVRQQKEEEERSQHHPPHHKQQQHQTTTLTADTPSPSSTRPPPIPAVPGPPARPVPAKKRKRKNRKRISKAAMRAMLM